MKNKNLFWDWIENFDALFLLTFRFQLIEYAIGTAITTQLNLTLSSLLISIWFEFLSNGFGMPSMANFIFGMSVKSRKRRKYMK